MKCLNCFIDCKEAVISLVVLIPCFPACQFSASSTPRLGTWALQNFLEWLCAIWWRGVPWGSLGENIVALLERDHSFFWEGTLAVAMSGGSDRTCDYSTSIGFLSYAASRLLPAVGVKPFSLAQFSFVHLCTSPLGLSYLDQQASHG